MDPITISAIAVAGVAGALGIGVSAKRSVHCLAKDDQLRIQGLTETSVVNGPGVKVVNPCTTKSKEVVKAESVDTLSYIIILDTLTGEKRLKRGPGLVYLDPYDNVVARQTGITLTATEFVIVSDSRTGKKEIRKGPMVWFPEHPYEDTTGKRSAIPLQEDEYTLIIDTETGERFMKTGKALIFLEPTWRQDGGVRKAYTLRAYEYLRLYDNTTGKTNVHRGEKMVFPGCNESVLDDDKRPAIDLMINEYVKIEDMTTSTIKVEKGPTRVFLGPNDKVVDGGKKKAVQIDEEQAVLVRDISNGQLRLVTEKQLFVPGPHETIDDIRKLIRLADHEAVLVKDKDGVVTPHYGRPDKQDRGKRAFFLPPHAELMTLFWSTGLRRLKRDLQITRFDTRPQYMWFEFDCRTGDNVELVLETTVFWEVQDLEKLVRSTGNLPGDMYNQARAQFIKHVAQVTLKKFMDELHVISNKVHQEAQPFYDARGVTIHSLEVTKYHCAEKRTSEVLQQIIEETTNRLNRLSQAESENEVNLYRIQGQIEHEKLNGSLLDIRQQHAQSESRAGGAAEAERAAAFVSGLQKDVPKLEDRLLMWQTLRKQDALSVVSDGGAQMYYTPNDVNLSIKTEQK